MSMSIYNIILYISAALDPLIKLKAFDSVKYSKPKNKVGSGSTYWGEHYFFNKSFQVFL